MFQQSWDPTISYQSNHLISPISNPASASQLGFLCAAAWAACTMGGGRFCASSQAWSVRGFWWDISQRMRERTGCSGIFNINSISKKKKESQRYESWPIGVLENRGSAPSSLTAIWKGKWGSNIRWGYLLRVAYEKPWRPAILVQTTLVFLFFTPTFCRCKMLGSYCSNKFGACNLDIRQTSILLIK